ncbi:MAG: hypothetical protein AAGA17_00265 [Actinomycetota bacterium]
MRLRVKCRWPEGDGTGDGFWMPDLMSITEAKAFIEEVTVEDQDGGVVSMSVDVRATESGELYIDLGLWADES